jgi:putative nucleotidyltransferase with HDIG domain
MRAQLHTRSDRLTVAGAAATLVLAISLASIYHSFGDLRIFAAFALLIAASEMFEVTLPNDIPFSLGIAPALGFALLGPVIPPQHHSLPETLIVFAAGVGIASAVRLLGRQPLHIADLSTHLLALGAAAVAYRAAANVAPHPLFDTTKTDISMLGFVAMLGVLLLVEVLLSTLRSVERERIPTIPVFVGGLRSTGALHLSVLSVGALLALAYPFLGYWAFPLFLAPLAATQFAFRQFASIRKTYLQTIRALSKVPEMAGYTEPGHSRRVAELSVDIARELGASDAEVSEIEYAALLHDIGRVSIPDPTTASDSSRTQLAIVGATIVRETGHFPNVAEMIEHQHDAYRRRGEETNRKLTLGSKIIKVASSYDDWTRPGSNVGLSSWDAIERLHQGMAYDYDPGVIQALRRVLEKRAI